MRIATAPLANTPAYTAGLDLDDELLELDGVTISSPEEVAAAIRRRKPGDRVHVRYRDRSGATKAVTVAITENPQLELVPVEAAGGLLTPEQREFRAGWLGKR